MGIQLVTQAKGMLLFLIGDDPQKRPYSKASQALFSDIEHGCLPQVVLGDVPCKFRNGTIVCEVTQQHCHSKSACGDEDLSVLLGGGCRASSVRH